MVKRNTNFSQLAQHYLFPEISRRVRSFKQANPSAHLINLSVGDTSEPIPAAISEAMAQEAIRLHTNEGYRGYGPEQGDLKLREKISEVMYKSQIAPDEIFISDGAKCDIGRLQALFGTGISIAIQDPAYPVYADTAKLLGRNQIHFLPCNAKEGFFPKPDELPKVDLLFLCSPNNPTGACISRSELAALVAWAKEMQSIIIFDAAYSAYIQDPSYPSSIYEIPGAKEVAIEISSFSKLAGFSGIRLGWSVVPFQLHYDEGHQVHADWTRIATTFFNGASLLAQAGGIAALSAEGFPLIKKQLLFYLENAKLLRTALLEKGQNLFGGEHAPYLWIEAAGDSWSQFQKILDQCHIVTSPGSGFGSSGEGYLRMSAFGKREEVALAAQRIEKEWPENL